MKAEAIAPTKKLASQKFTLPGWFYTWGLLIVFLIVWEAITKFAEIPAYILPSFSDVVRSIVKNASLLATHTGKTLYVVFLSYAVSILLGIPLAVLISYSPIMERVLYAPMVAINSIPKIALAPLFVVWFGLGLVPTVLIAVLVAFFPIVINTVVGLTTTDKEMIYLARSLGASPNQIFFKIRLPRALPNIFAGLKVAIALVIVGAITGEFIGSDEGLGYLLLVAGGRLETTLVFADILILSAIGILSFNIIDWVERLALPWHRNKVKELNNA
jgi:NitT/TauT family transport system permease protein